jgi:hypothetical protein
MDIKPWNEVEISEAEAVLFIYLMFRKDYPEHIAKEFRDAIGGKFSWDNVPGSDIKELLRCLKDYFDIEWTEYVEIKRKINDGKTIQICRGGKSAEIKIDEIMEKATLKISDGRTHDLKVKKENGKLTIIFKEKKWDDRVKLGALKHSNKVSGILKGMARKNLLLELPRPGVGRPKKNSIEEDMVNNSRRKYYRVNPCVLGMSHRLVLTEKENKEIREYIRQDEKIGCDPEELLPEQYAELACIFGLSDIDSKVNLGFLSSNTISSALRLLELCAPDELSCIRFINTLKKYDCLTIFMTAGAMFTEILNYISPDEYKLRLYPEYTISLDESEEELKKKIRRWYERRLDYITKDKDNYINNEIDHALHSKKIANLLRLDSQFLRLNNIDRKIEQVGKKLRTSHPNARDLRSVIEHLDSIIIQIPYIERGF